MSIKRTIYAVVQYEKPTYAKLVFLSFVQTEAVKYQKNFWPVRSRVVPFSVKCSADVTYASELPEQEFASMAQQYLTRHDIGLLIADYYQALW